MGDVLSPLNIPRGFTFCLQVSCAGHMTFANSSDPYQARQNVGPDLGPNCLTDSDSIQGIFFENVNFQKN